LKYKILKVGIESDTLLEEGCSTSLEGATDAVRVSLSSMGVLLYDSFKRR
jgi:hypothetical protein